VKSAAGRRLSATDVRYMDEALALARRGVGRTTPNPAVGALVVRGGRVIGRGFHRRAGGPHAEIFALRKARRHARGATLYVTLEPCCHVGRTGPCVDTVVGSGVSRVVVGTVDPNPKVRGRGIAALRRAGISVDVGIREAECRELNEDFEKYIETGLPFVVLKLASTLDGRIATANGDSRWVTGEAARRHVHAMRARYDCVIVGSETVRADDPELTCRIRGGRDPLRVVLDGRLRVPETARVVRHRPEGTRIYTLADRSAKAERLRRLGLTVVRGGGDRAGSLRRVLADLGRAGLKSALIEGGGRVAARALREGLVDRLALFLAPKLLGAEGRPVVGSLGIARMSDTIRIIDAKLERVGEDYLVTGRPAFRSPARRAKI
jgi:diaminohydroxyphosphoribosylaminopyrimidine deaminase / 5-amino-6-(5-phosphoribosylamino)uracil reductase